MTSPEPASDRPGPRAVAVAVVAALMALPLGAGLPALALVGLAGEDLQRTALVVVATAVAMVLFACVAAAPRARPSRLHRAMGGGLAGMVVVGFPLFVALEPVWWRFAAGIPGAIAVVAMIAWGAPMLDGARGGALAHARAWMGEPPRAIAVMLTSILGLDRLLQRKKKKSRVMGARK